MEITHSKILLSILIGMRGCITSNLRAISVKYSSDYIFLYFYYQEQPTEEGEDLAEEIASKVVSDFPDIALKSFEVKKIVIPYPNRVPDVGFLVFHRYELTPPD